ncbi:MAG: methylmalonate-semialdehyde dehydrogenase, partial [Modestobacter sp.]|nr:methylmalonate-semialdehyde dehydrogenase [Modestobacter sp.]
MPTSIPHWIDGARREGASGRTSPVTDPATGEVTGEVALADVAEVDAAVAAATAAFPAWRDTSLARRTTVLFAFRELLNA